MPAVLEAVASKTLTYEEIKAAAEALPPDQRLELSTHLHDISFEELDAIRAEWSEEAKRRFADLEAGRTKTVPFEEVFKQRREARNAAS